MMLTHEQSYEENKTEFVKRLVEAGWTEPKAQNEYEEMQTFEYPSPDSSNGRLVKHNTPKMRRLRKGARPKLRK
jgi:hypothetical protein